MAKLVIEINHHFHFTLFVYLLYLYIFAKLKILDSAAESNFILFFLPVPLFSLYSFMRASEFQKCAEISRKKFSTIKIFSSVPVDEMYIAITEI